MDCMLHGCKSSPVTGPLKRFLEGELMQRYQPDNTISFKQWVSTDRSTLEARELDQEEFVNEILANSQI